MKDLDSAAHSVSEEAKKEFPFRAMLHSEAMAEFQRLIDASDKSLAESRKALEQGRKDIEELDKILGGMRAGLEEPSTSELLLHFGIEEAGSPGAMLDEATAKASPCSCFTYKGKDLCWSKGVVGMLSQGQQRLYCVAGKTYKAQPALTERYERFAEAAEEAHKKIETMPKGIPRLEAWLSAMGEQLSKRGIEV